VTAAPAPQFGGRAARPPLGEGRADGLRGRQLRQGGGSAQSALREDAATDGEESWRRR
jgi:hypothetical protein